MQTFLEWLEALCEDRQRTVSPEILGGYDHAIRNQLTQMARQIEDPAIRSKFTTLIDCPIIDSGGSCRGFADYVLGALIRNGVHTRYDLEQALQYVFEKMLVPKSEPGKGRTTLFTQFDPNREESVGHFRARFLTWVKYAVNNIRRGNVPRLSNTEQRPQGTVSIGQGRWKDGDPSGAVSTDQIAARPTVDADFEEMIDDIKSLLERKERGHGLPLVRFFTAMMGGTRSDQARQFGDTATKTMRGVVKQTVQDYAERTGNYALLNMMKRYEGFQGHKPVPPARKLIPTVQKPVLSDQERDYASLLSVVDRLGRPAGTAQFGSARRRWLEYPPRSPSSGHRNRLEEVLARMVRDGVLTATKTTQGALVYSPGPNAHAYRQGPAV